MQNIQTSPKRFISRTRNIAEFLDRSERACYYLLENGNVPGAKKIGGTWMLDTAVFAESFRADSPVTPTRDCSPQLVAAVPPLAEEIGRRTAGKGQRT
jgi:hypothetical protein